MTRIRKKDEGGRRRRERSSFHLHTNPRRKGREQEGCSAAGWGFLFRVEGSTAVKRSWRGRGIYSISSRVFHKTKKKALLWLLASLMGAYSRDSIALFWEKKFINTSVLPQRRAPEGNGKPTSFGKNCQCNPVNGKQFTELTKNPPKAD